MQVTSKLDGHMSGELKKTSSLDNKKSRPSKVKQIDRSGLIKHDPPARPPDREIRMKLEKHLEKNRPVKSEQNSQSRPQRPEEIDQELVNFNNPEDPVTKEKLKHVLNSNGFNFSDKERKALGEILNK